MVLLSDMQEHYSFLVGVLAIMVTILIGFQIFQVIDFERKVRNISKKIAKDTAINIATSIASSKSVEIAKGEYENEINLVTADYNGFSQYLMGRIWQIEEPAEYEKALRCFNNAKVFFEKSNNQSMAKAANQAIGRINDKLKSQ